MCSQRSDDVRITPKRPEINAGGEGVCPFSTKISLKDLQQVFPYKTGGLKSPRIVRCELPSFRELQLRLNTARPQTSPTIEWNSPAFQGERPQLHKSAKAVDLGNQAPSIIAATSALERNSCAAVLAARFEPIQRVEEGERFHLGNAYSNNTPSPDAPYRTPLRPSCDQPRMAQLMTTPLPPSFSGDYNSCPITSETAIPGAVCAKYKFPQPPFPSHITQQQSSPREGTSAPLTNYYYPDIGSAVLHNRSAYNPCQLYPQPTLTHGYHSYHSAGHLKIPLVASPNFNGSGYGASHLHMRRHTNAEAAVGPLVTCPESIPSHPFMLEEGGCRRRACHNCGVLNTPSWRRCPHTGKFLCNACGLYQKLHNRQRVFRKTKNGGTRAYHPVHLIEMGLMDPREMALSTRRAGYLEASRKRCDSSPKGDASMIGSDGRREDDKVIFQGIVGDSNPPTIATTGVHVNGGDK